VGTRVLRPKRNVADGGSTGFILLDEQSMLGLRTLLCFDVRCQHPVSCWRGKNTRGVNMVLVGESVHVKAKSEKYLLELKGYHSPTASVNGIKSWPR
jgi:hypothetical protein